jgi:Na+/H+-dicarboxylate symporter
MRSIFKYQGMQVLILIVLYFSMAHLMPLVIHQGLYTISLFIKDLLMWMLPLTVGFFIASSVGSFKKQAPLFIISLILFETFSNFASVWYAYLGGHLAVDHLPPLKIATSNYDFTALWRLPIFRPAWWSADKGAFLGLVFGLIAALTKQPKLREFIEYGKQKAQWILTKLFSRVIPLFVLGFVARMYQMHLFQDVALPYSTLLVWLLILLALYLLALFTLGSNWNLIDISRSIKNLLPAGGLAFTSGCSISTMPWTIEGTSKNLDDPSFAKAVIPATTNIQQIGDCITNTFLCFLLYRHFFGSAPDFAMWALFSAVFVIARFATAAVIGGAIFIMLPIYESYLSFNAEMIAIILAFNVILDPIVTSTNVIGNGALCRIYEKVWIFLKGKLPVEKVPGSLREK